MNSESVLKMVKKDLLPIVDRLELDSLQDDLDRIKTYVKIIESLSVLNRMNELRDTENEKNTVAPPSHESIDGETDKDPLKQKNVYVFERKLKGGYIQEIDAYVPETAVRQLSLDEGDLIRAVPIRRKDKKRMYYDFDLVKKINTDNPNRKEIKYCVVENDGYIWCANRTLSGKSIELADMPFTLRIRDADAREFHLSEGDIVDIAYYEDNPVASKVIWKHHFENNEYVTPLPHGAYKERENTGEDIQKHPALQNKTVTLIGSIDRQSSYRERLTVRGADFQAMDGTENEHRIAALIQRSDLVIIIIPQVSHGGMSTAKKLCKMYHVPFETVDSIGTTSVVNTAIRLAKELTVKIES